jgi:hypothetical protein
MVAWSIVTLLSYKARNYTEMLVCRFFLGLVEAPVGAFCFHRLSHTANHKLTLLGFFRIVLPRCRLHSLHAVHSKGDRFPHGHLLLRQYHGTRSLWHHRRWNIQMEGTMGISVGVIIMALFLRFMLRRRTRR